MLAINIARGPFSYQSPIPACAGTPRYEKWRCELAEVFVCHSRFTPPQAGDKPLPYRVLTRLSAVAVIHRVVGHASWRRKSIFVPMTTWKAGRFMAGDKPIALRSLRPRHIYRADAHLTTIS